MRVVEILTSPKKDEQMSIEVDCKVMLRTYDSVAGLTGI